jgi:hypothetical protein
MLCPTCSKPNTRTAAGTAEPVKHARRGGILNNERTFVPLDIAVMTVSDTRSEADDKPRATLSG